MNLFLQNKTQNIFLHKDSKFDIEDNVNIILSPELYWVREFSLPAKNEKEALKFIPAFFEDILLGDNEYRYHVKKVDDGVFLSFAYDTEVLKDTIKNANLNISKVVNIYFGQFELQGFESFTVDAKTFYYEEGILLKLPKNLKVESRRLQSFDDIKLSNQKIKFDLYPKWLQSRTVYSVSILLFLVSVMNFVKVYSFKQDINKFEQNKQELIQNHKLPQSLIQLNSIVKSSKRKEQKTTKRKELLSYLLAYKQKPNSLKFLSLKYNQKDIVIQLESKNKQDIENYKRYIVKQYKANISNKKDNYTIKVKL